MKTRYVIFGACLATIMPAMAQETYEIANIATQDLDGTARYVGMGGAMDALGGDLSVISSNPAGIGVYRSNDAAVSFGFVSQQGGKSFGSGNKTNMSFDQVGFVYSMKTGFNDRNRFNFAFNYHKSRNFDYILSAANTLNGTSQNMATAAKMNAAGVTPSNYNDFTNSSVCSQVDVLNAEAGLAFYQNGSYNYYGANDYMLNRANTGYIGQYDFNISGSLNNRVFLGLTIGLYDVHYNGYSQYQEDYDNSDALLTTDSRKITGTGVDVKAGVIFRPIEDSPFRIGLSVSSPTYYRLTSSNSTSLAATNGTNKNISNSYDYNFYTPWKFGLSLGHTVGNYLAFGAGYEYADYSTCDARVDNGYDYYGNSEDYSDDDMNSHISRTLRGVSTFKVGVEAKIDPSIAIRVGYNYVSPMYKTNGFRDSYINSYGSYYASTTDYVNWKATNRFTCGLGFRFDKCYIDLAYQYSQQDGDFYPFSFYEYANMSDSKYNVDTYPTKVSNKRHQMLATIGFKF